MEVAVPDEIGLLVRESCGVRIRTSDADPLGGAERSGRRRSPVGGSLVPELALEKTTDGEAVAV